MPTMEITINACNGLEADALPTSKNEFWSPRKKALVVVFDLFIAKWIVIALVAREHKL